MVIWKEPNVEGHPSLALFISYEYVMYIILLIWGLRKEWGSCLFQG